MSDGNGWVPPCPSKHFESGESGPATGSVSPQNQKICDSFAKKRDCFANFSGIPVNFTTVKWPQSTEQYGTIRAKNCMGGQGNPGGSGTRSSGGIYVGVFNPGTYGARISYFSGSGNQDSKTSSSRVSRLKTFDISEKAANNPSFSPSLPSEKRRQVWHSYSRGSREGSHYELGDGGKPTLPFLSRSIHNN